VAVPEFFTQNEQPKEVTNLAHMSYKRLSLWGNLMIALEYVVSDTRKQKRSFVIGVMTVFLVVCFLSLIQNALDRSGVIFVKLAEDQVGQYDIVMTPSSNNQSTSFFLNYTSMNTTLLPATVLVGTAPRWLLVADVYNTVTPNLTSSSIVLIFDTDLETVLSSLAFVFCSLSLVPCPHFFISLVDWPWDRLDPPSPGRE